MASGFRTSAWTVNDPLQTSGPRSPRGICLNLANDQKVFAVTGYADAAGECVARQYRLPVVNLGGRLEQTYSGSNNLFVSVGEFIRAIQRIGSVPGLPSASSGSFATGKTDYDDGLRPVRWSMKTHSWSAAGPPFPVSGG